MYWVKLTISDLGEVLNTQELEALQSDGNAIAESLLTEVSLLVRESVANNQANILDATDALSIPITLKGTALSIMAVRLLKRYDLLISDDRQKDHDAAATKLREVATGEFKVLAPDGSVPVPPGLTPEIAAPPADYGSGATGFYPTPNY